MSYSGSMTRKIAVGVFVLLFATALLFAAAQDTSNWKRYRNSEYGFEIAYPADWEFDANYEDNYGKPPSGNRPAAYAGETRNLFDLEMDCPDQSHEGGGYFEDGAIISVEARTFCNADEVGNLFKCEQLALGTSADGPAFRFLSTAIPIRRVHPSPPLMYDGS